MIESRKNPDFQVINASDFRLPGGTSHSISEEVRVQSEASIPTGLVHINSTIMRRALPWSKPMQEVANLPHVDVVTPIDVVHTEILIIRHPTTLKDLANFLPRVTCNQLIIVANHAANDSDGSVNYDPGEITEKVRQRFGIEPKWRPIGPVVRATLEPYLDQIDLGSDWLNVFSTSGTAEPRESIHRRPTIGRHSRPQAAKWPDSATDIRSAYPMDKEFDVRILGGSAAAEAVVQKRPSNWTVYEFGAMEPEDFLQKIDFWVYFHHPKTLEAYGRAVMEALYSGCVVILPEYMRDSFHEAAVYCTPREVRSVVRSFVAEPERYFEQSARGQEFAASLGPSLHMERLESLGAQTLPNELTTVDDADHSESHLKSEKPYRFLFITSNGAGMGHLTRTLAIARALDKMGAEAVFMSLSQGVPVVREQGFIFEYMPSSGALGVPASDWNEYFVVRLREMIQTVQPHAIVFDGTVPYNGLVRVLSETDLYRVWIRRGMWRESSPARSLRRESKFDMVIEPGEYASEYDRGPTKGRPSSNEISPVTLLRSDEMLDRVEARKALGISGEERCVLLTLGAGNINDIDDLQTTIIEHMVQRHPNWSVYVTKPPISESVGDSSLNVLRTYPLARIANAFDFAVSAAGYNSFHEWLAMGIPALWIPNELTSIDDQVSRARWAQDSGCGLALLPEDEDDGSAEYKDGSAEHKIGLLLDRMTSYATRQSMVARMDALVTPNGAKEAASMMMNGVQR